MFHDGFKLPTSTFDISRTFHSLIIVVSTHERSLIVGTIDNPEANSQLAIQSLPCQTKIESLNIHPAPPDSLPLSRFYLFKAETLLIQTP